MSAEPRPRYRAGAHLRNDRWGNGQVVAVYGSEPYLTIDVRFGRGIVRFRTTLTPYELVEVSGPHEHPPS